MDFRDLAACAGEFVKLREKYFHLNFLFRLQTQTFFQNLVSLQNLIT